MNDDNTPECTIMEDLTHVLNGQETAPPERKNLIPVTKQMKTIAIGEYLVTKGDTLNIF